MAEIKVTKYALAWQSNTNTGRIVLQIEGSNDAIELDVNTAGEFAAISAVLGRKTVHYDTDLGTIRSSEQLIS